MIGCCFHVDVHLMRVSRQGVACWMRRLVSVSVSVLIINRGFAQIGMNGCPNWITTSCTVGGILLNTITLLDEYYVLNTSNNSRKSHGAMKKTVHQLNAK